MSRLLSLMVSYLSITSSSQMKNRMTAEDYRRNLRGVNDGADFSPELLVGALRLPFEW